MYNKFEQNKAFSIVKKALNYLIPKYFAVCILLSLTFATVQSVYSAVGIRETINFQGKLVNSAGLNVADGNYSVVFSLYTVSSGGTNLWQETQNVSTVDGLFRIELGSVSSLSSVNFNNDSLYLGIKVGADAEMTPRVRYTATPYAFQAKNVSWSGLQSPNANTSLSMAAYTTSLLYSGTSGSNDLFVLSSSANSTGTGRLMSLRTATDSEISPFHVSAKGIEALFVSNLGRVGIGTVSPTTALVVDGTKASGFPAISGSTQTGDILRLTGASDLADVTIDFGTAYSGTNYFGWLQATNKSSLGVNYNLLLNPNGGNVGIGTTSPSSSLHVKNSAADFRTLALESSSTGLGTRAGILFKTRTDSPAKTAIFTEQTATTFNQNAIIFAIRNALDWNEVSATDERMRIDVAGNVGIGTTSPQGKLHSQRGSSGQTITNVTGILSENDGNSNNFFALQTVTASGFGLSVTNAGNVGIGTTAPTSALSVNGLIDIPGSNNPTLSKRFTGSQVFNYTADAQIRKVIQFANTDANAKSGVIFGTVTLTFAGMETGNANPVYFVRRYNVRVRDWYTGGPYPMTAYLESIYEEGGQNKITLDVDGTPTSTALALKAKVHQNNGTFEPGSQLTISFDFTSSAVLAGNFITPSFADGSPTSGDTGTQGAVILAGSGGNVGIGTVAPRNKLTIVSDGLNIGESATEDYRIYRNTTSAHLVISGSQTSYMGVDIMAGNVGIGTTAALNKLHVQGTTAGPAGIYLNSAVPSSTSFTLYNNAGTLTWNGVALATGASVSGTTNYLARFTGPNTLGNSVIFDNGTNVGIGTTSPGVKLDVNGQIRSYAPTGEIYSYSTNANNTAKVFAGWTNNTGMQIGYLPQTAQGYVENTYPITAGQVFGDIYFRQNSAGTMVTRMTIKADGGNVGIGTTNPGTRLSLDNAAVANAAFSINRTNNATGYANIRFDTGGAAKFYIGLDKDLTPNSDKFTIYDVSVGMTAMTITNGNVGIGTTTPRSKLEVFNSATSQIILSTGNAQASYRDWAFNAGGDAAGGLSIQVGSSAGTSPVATVNTKMFISSAGNVGIGTVSPSSQLDIFGTTAGLQLSYDANDYGRFTVASDGALTLSGVSGGGALTNIARYSTSQINMDVPTSFNSAGDVSMAYDLYLSNQTASAIKSDGPLTIQSGEAFENLNLTLKASGQGNLIVQSKNIWADGTNVGIGTTAPSAFLNIRANNYQNLIGLGGSQADNIGYFSFWSNSSPNQQLTIGGLEGIRFLTGPHTSPTEMMRLSSSGNVGIGTVSPTDKLNIVTTAAYGGLTLESTVASNYQTALNFKHPNGSTFGRLGYDQNTDSIKIMNLSTWPGVGADILFYTNNDTTTPKMAISRAGNVGIGTTSPGYKLDVSGDVNITGSYRINGVAQSGSSKWTSGTVDNIYRSIGNVGIGTTSPQNNLDVRGSVDNFSASLARDLAVNQWTGLHFGYSEAGNTLFRKSAIVFERKDGAARGSIHILNDSGFDNGSANLADSKFTIDLNGNVGIGTTNPNHKLVVEDNLNGANVFRIRNLNSGTTASSILRIGNNTLENMFDASAWSSGFTETPIRKPNGVSLVANGAGGLTLSASGANGTIRLFTGGENATNQRMTILSDGNVGIGTVSPVAKLMVTGDANGGNNEQFFITGATNTNKRLRLGYDTTGNYGRIQAITYLSSYDNLALNPDGGNVGIGTTAPTLRLEISAPFGAPVTSGITPNGNFALTSPDVYSSLYMGIHSNQAASNYSPWIQAADRNSLGTYRSLLLNPNGGNVGIGTTNPIYALDVRATGTGIIARFSNNNNVGCTLANAGTINCTSDSRLKKDAENLSSGLNFLSSLRPITYRWNDESSSDLKSAGFLAQEVESINPKLVTTDDQGIKQLNTIGLVPYTIAAIQEQQLQIEAQSSALQALDPKILDLENTLAQIELERATAVSQEEGGTAFENLYSIVEDTVSRVVSLENSVAEILSRIDSLVAPQISASDSARIEDLSQRMSFVEAMFMGELSTGLNSTASAQLAMSISENEIIFDRKVVAEGNLSVLGETNLGDVGVTGNITNNMLVINGFDESLATPGASLNTLAGALNIQSSGLNSINFVEGSFKMDTDGNFIIHKGNLEVSMGSVKGNDGIRGINVSVGQSQVEMRVNFKAKNDTENYAVGISPSWFTNFLVSGKDENGFTVKFSTPAPQGAKFDWIVIE